jgi:CIC family chloride channel protein
LVALTGKIEDYFFSWRKRYLNDRQFLLLASILVGLSAGLAAVLLRTFVAFLHQIVVAELPFQSAYVLYALLPLGGILAATAAVQLFFKGKLSKGTGLVHHSIARSSSMLEHKHTYAHVLTSGLTMGFGGSAGLEAPIVVTGAAVGANFGKTYHMPLRDRTLMLACGAAGGIAAVFHAPIAGVLFAIEVLLVDVSVSALVPLILAAVSGGLLSRFVYLEESAIQFEVNASLTLTEVPFYALLAIFIGLLSLYYARVYLALDAFFLKFKQQVWAKALTGGLLLGLLCVAFPPLFGEGYRFLTRLAAGEAGVLAAHSPFGWFQLPFWGVWLFLFACMLLKVWAAAITVDSGGNGGNFAPSMFTGALAGYLFASAVNTLGIANLPVTNFMLVGMAGMVSGVIYAPLTGVFLIAELTGGYGLMIPLMLVSAGTFAWAKYRQPYAIDKRKLAKRGQLLTHDKDKNILATIRTSSVLERDFATVPYHGTLRDLVGCIAKSKRNIFPVVDESGHLKGVVLLEHVRERMFQQDIYDSCHVAELMEIPPAVLSPDDAMMHVMRKFDETGAWNLPVTNDGVYLGFVSKSAILTSYRNHLVAQSTDYL